MVKKRKVLTDEEKIAKLQAKINSRAQINFEMCLSEVIGVCKKANIHPVEIAKALATAHKINYTVQMNDNDLAIKLLTVVKQQPKTVSFI